MAEEKALMLRPRQVTPDSYKLVRAIASECGISTLQMLTAYEYGIPLSACKTAVHMMPSGNALAPKVVWGKIITHPDFDGYEEKRLAPNGKFEGWELTLKRANGISVTRRFTITQASKIIINKAGKKLIEKDNWQNYPERMCFWRAMSACQDVVFPDVTFGIYRADELGAEITPDGEVIDAQVRELPPILHQDLIDKFGLEAVMEAGGLNTTDPAELHKISDKLAMKATSEESDG